jgi:hypothetical protein
MGDKAVYLLSVISESSSSSSFVLGLGNRDGSLVPDARKTDEDDDVDEED